ncbi:hypothetical protein LCGC14_2019590 [marine sediment metagenome]|uniref:Uncharacterized protein n=1 Tax=marine sediment metagenome TaxID=412755 RepID=A0A0F9HV14_9ZZZZ
MEKKPIDAVRTLCPSIYYYNHKNATWPHVEQPAYSCKLQVVEPRPHPPEQGEEIYLLPCTIVDQLSCPYPYQKVQRIPKEN